MRKSLRTAALGVAPNLKKEIVVVGDEKIEVRQPCVKARGAILTAGKAANEHGVIGDFAGLQIQAVIECCFDPETGEQIFEQADADALAKLPAGGIVDQLANVALNLMNGKAAEVAGNSERTPSGSSSSQ